MENFIIIAVVLVIVVAISVYLWRAKKRGQTCIGCPCSKQCGGGCKGGCAPSKAKGESDK